MVQYGLVVGEMCVVTVVVTVVVMLVVVLDSLETDVNAIIRSIIKKCTLKFPKQCHPSGYQDHSLILQSSVRSDEFDLTLTTFTPKLGMAQRGVLVDVPL